LRATLPENERERLVALYRYDVLDTAPEPSFDRLTRMAARAFDAPLSLISLVDRERQFLKSHQGLENFASLDNCAILEPREVSFCSHAILTNEITVVCDAAADSRFADNPLVTGDTHIRFYAAAPLRTKEGFHLGTICVLDQQPRPAPDGKQLALLGDLADEVMEQLEIRWHKRRFAAESRHLASSRENIQKAQQRAMQALESGHMGYWDRDAETDLITFSPVLEEMLGLDHDSYDGSVDGWMQHVHPDDRPVILSRIAQARRDGKNYEIKYRPLTKDGSERWITSTGTYLKDAQGRFAGAHGVSWDSTQSELAARKLRMSEELFRILSDSAPIGIYRTDAASNLIYANATLARYNGVPAEELLGKGWMRWVHPEDLEGLLKLLATDSKGSREHEHRLLPPDGSVRWVRARTTILKDQNGNPLGKVGTVDDITAERQMLADLRKAKETAEVANRAKDMFLANVSHELRTPLNGVLGMSELLMESGLSAEQLDMAEIVRDSARGLLSVVNDMLDLSRIEAGRLAIEYRPFHLPSVMQQTISLFRAQAVGKGITLVLHYAEGLPESFLGDPGRIRQILTNYLSNALKFTPAGEIRIEARAEMPDHATADPVEVLLSVQDCGLGISPEAQRKLFQPFSQVDASSTRRNGGVGLGLAICKRLAELMHGAVGVSSTSGQGSTFWVSLPLVPQPLPVVKTDPPAKTRGVGAPSSRVLLVEDNLVNQKVAVGTLRRLGWTADVADNGLTAVELCKANDYAVILMDCQMPEMDGYAATRRIRDWEASQGRANVPIVALTAHAMTGDKELCLAAGMNDYLAKPLGFEELREALERWTAVSMTTFPKTLSPAPSAT
jgi:PAS domain S-box-containing protein